MKLLSDVAIKCFRLHYFRYHFSSKLIIAGVDLNMVRELSGHSELKMILMYPHLDPEHKAAAINLIL
ncbi:tyrosine-type recombinase/integrase [Vibrio xiamenensis]|uniref:tyrosine-type recombinase/integrase n=1 Tax=Vibrio xiamenensis TaxID=861298 RepID=UPI000B81EBC9